MTMRGGGPCGSKVHRGSQRLLERPWNKFCTVCLRYRVESGDVRVQSLWTANIDVQDERRGSVFNARSENSFVQTSKSDLWKICSNIRSSMDSNGALLLDMEDHFYYSLDRLGAQIWITIETSPSGIAFDDLLDAVETHFDTPRNQLADDLRDRLQRLRALGFIETLRKI
jgi:hypothetical protein